MSTRSFFVDDIEVQFCDFVTGLQVIATAIVVSPTGAIDPWLHSLADHSPGEFKDVVARVRSQLLSKGSLEIRDQLLTMRGLERLVIALSFLAVQEVLQEQAGGGKRAAVSVLLRLGQSALQ